MKTGLYIYLILTASALLFIGCGSDQRKNFLGSGILETDEVLISSLAAGRLDSLFAREGQPVAAGQIIALLDTAKMALQRVQTLAAMEELVVNRHLAQNAEQQAQTQRDNVAANFERQKSLLQSGSSTQQIVDDLGAQADLARLRTVSAREQMAALEAKETQLEAALHLINLQMQDAVIAAPRSGVITEKYVEAGENVPLGGAIVKMADLGRMWIKIYLSEQDVGSVTLNSRLRVIVDALPDHPFEGRVSWISPKAEFTPRNVQTRASRADLVYAVKIEVENPAGLAAIGMPADVFKP